MTLAALLGELRDVDADAWHGLEDALSCLDEMQEDDNYAVDVLKTIAVEPKAKDLLQGCIQRACEMRGWTWKVFKQTTDNEKSHCGEIGKVAPGYDGDYYNQYHEYCIASVEGDSAAEALLSAYIAAVREEAKR
jgi:hypothetical protein